MKLNKTAIETSKKNLVGLFVYLLTRATQSFDFKVNLVLGYQRYKFSIYFHIFSLLNDIGKEKYNLQHAFEKG